MKKKILLFVIIIALLSGMVVYAATPIKSKGNLIVKNGEDVSFYAEDINYLQNELCKLFEEVTK